MIILIYTEEVFKTITYPGVKRNYYEISNYGTVRNKITGKIKVPFEHKDHLRIALANEERAKSDQTNRSVHRLVAWEFCDGWKPGYVVNHLNSDGFNNFSGNLEWCTHKENSIHGAYYGNIQTGESHYLNKFTEKQIRDICKLLEDGLSNTEILRYYGFQTKRNNPPLYKVIDHIRHRRSWKQVSCEYKF